MYSRNKRARLELSMTPSVIDAGVGNGGAVNTTYLTSTTGGTENVFLGNATNSTINSAESVGMLPTNVFLTICDDNSEESHDFLAIGSTFAQIKEEHEEALSMGNVSSSSSTQATQTLPLQYRIVNQMQRHLSNMENINSSGVVCNNPSNTLSATTLPMQLPSGCEIYIVKEYVDNMPSILTEESELMQGPPSPITTTTTEAIKLEPDSSVTSTAGAIATTSATAAINGVQILCNTALPCMFTSKVPNGRINSNRNATTTASIDASDNSTKRSCILEAYKKRDDKRRATHNEVERRRRDKINNWIFKLKEMLPTEGANSNNNNSQQNGILEQLITKPNNNTNTSTCNGSSNSSNNNSNRTPPSDSKSQILIKACEYIKTMQDEIKSLRECLSENENLRLSNQRLQNELTKLHSERTLTAGATLHTRNFNSNFNITLNSLNSNNSNGSTGGGGSASSSPGGSSNIFNSTNTFTKRELIIRDFVD